MSAVRAIAGANSWSLSTGFKDYFVCCFSKTESTPASADDATKAAPDATEPAADRVGSRWSSAASKSDDGCKTVDGRPEADGASVHSTGTDKANISGTGYQPSGNMTSLDGAGASIIYFD